MKSASASKTIYQLLSLAFIWPQQPRSFSGFLIFIKFAQPETLSARKLKSLHSANSNESVDNR